MPVELEFDSEITDLEICVDNAVAFYSDFEGFKFGEYDSTE